MTNHQTDYYAVIGNPISHSLSPRIHSEFARQTEQNLSYSAELVEMGEVNRFVHAFMQNNGKGLNVTLPFKQDAFELATELSPRAQRAGAVNTLILANNNIRGDTTDGVGLLNDLKKNHRQNLKDKHILVIGAGGAVRGVLEPLLLESPQFDLVINGTSASLSGTLPPLPDKLFAENACAYDMMYAKEPTIFMQWARQQGAKKVLDGLGMLVEQAAESFYLWRDVRPETQKIIHDLRSD